MRSVAILPLLFALPAFAEEPANPQGDAPNTFVPPPPTDQRNPEGPGGGMPPVAGASLRLLLREAGFGEVAGESTAAAAVPAVTPAPPGAPGPNPGAPVPPPPGVAPPHSDHVGPSGAQGAHAHAVVPHVGGGAAPGFVLRLVLPAGVRQPPDVEVGTAHFVPNDAGLAPDTTPTDGIWSVMVERYPGGAPVVVRQGDIELGRADIHLVETGDIPEMRLTLR